MILAKAKVKYVSLNSAKSFVGRHVNVTMLDGYVIVNVKLVRIADRRSLVFAEAWAPHVDLADVRLLTPISPYAFLQEGSE